MNSWAFDKNGNYLPVKDMRIEAGFAFVWSEIGYCYIICLNCNRRQRTCIEGTWAFLSIKSLTVRGGVYRPFGSTASAGRETKAFQNSTEKTVEIL